MTRALAVGIWLLLAAPLGAAEPLVVELPARASVASSVVTVGGVGRISGGTAHGRAKLGRVDLAEIGPKESGAALTRRQVEFRLRLAGYDDDEFLVIGAERTTALIVRRPIPSGDVVAAAKAELAARLGLDGGGVAVTLTQPVGARLPEAAADDDVRLIAEPHAGTVALGRMQMNVTILVRGEKRLTLPVFLESKRTADAPAIAAAAAAVARAPEVGAAVIVKPRQRVRMLAQVGGLQVEAAGEAMQDGKLGQTIRVLNVDSKKAVSARVTGPDTVEVTLGGGP